MKIVATGQKEFPQHLSRLRLGRARPEDIWKSVVATVRAALRKAKLSATDIAAIGITNQRETVTHLGRRNRQADPQRHCLAGRRTAAMCEKLKKKGSSRNLCRKTGLLLDPYFSGTKIAWLLDNVKGARRAPKKASWPARSTAS
jgi:glycerol kinase